MGKRYTASITASPTMKVLYFRAVTRNLAPTRGLRQIPCSRIGSRWNYLNIVFHVCISHTAVLVSFVAERWLERDLADATFFSSLREILFVPWVGANVHDSTRKSKNPWNEHLVDSLSALIEMLVILFLFSRHFIVV